MSTPTALQLGAVPSPASKKTVASNSVSTPAAHSLSSPAPRSVPSPAAARKESGKTPANHATTGSSQGSKTVGATPMMPNLSQQGSTASPMPGGFSGMTPTGLGLDLGTPGHLSIATPSFAAAMAPTMSELGITIKRNEDEERRIKMRKILKTIGRPKGRVSEEGIARISRRVGFANDIDAEKLTVEERERRVGNRTISIAGNTIVIDVELKEHIPRNVQVLFSNDMSRAGDQAERAGNVLLQDLTDSRAPPINRMLDQFASNLELLAKLDRLSSARVNCFDALSGIHTSLKRLYDAEFKMAQELYSNRAREHVTNKLSGYPSMHANGVLGLSLDYWIDQSATDPDQMDIDRKHDIKDAKIWFSTERCSSVLYPPIRITDAWLPETVEVQQNDNAHTIPWLDPPPTYLAAEDGNPMSEDVHILPDIRFVAKFDPPIILPWQIADALYTAVGSRLPPPTLQTPAFISALLNLPVIASLPSTFTSQTKVLRPEKDDFVEVTHNYSTSVAKHDHGYRLEELPFSTPREIVDVLPILRQWRRFNHLLLQEIRISASSTITRSSSSLADIIADASVDSSEMAIECAFYTTPAASMSLTFQLASGELCTAEVQVLLGGKLHLVGSDDNSKAAKALALCDDIGVWTEWVRINGIS